MKDTELMAGLRESIQQMKQGETIAFEDVEKGLDRIKTEPLEDVLKELGWDTSD